MNSHYSQYQLSRRALRWWTIGASCAGLVACSGGDTLESVDGEAEGPGLQTDDPSLATDEPETSLVAGEPDPSLATDESELGALEKALNGQLAGTIEMGWNLWGWTLVTAVGGSCPQGKIRDRVEITSHYGAPATSTWLFSNEPTDCSALITTSVQNGHFDTFNWRIVTRPVNLAASKPASQSSSPYGGGAERAVDGNTDGNWSASSVTHTGWEAQPWWQVDLGAVKSIGKVVLHNRTDCCSDRLSDFDILVSQGVDPYTGSYNWTVAASLGGQAPPKIEFPVSNSGRFVRVQLRGTNYLSLAEVQVFVP